MEGPCRNLVTHKELEKEIWSREGSNAKRQDNIHTFRDEATYVFKDIELD